MPRNGKKNFFEGQESDGLGQGEGGASVVWGSSKAATTTNHGLFNRILEIVSRWSIYILVFILPFFFLPQLSSIYLSKQFLAAILILLGAIAVIGRVLLSGEAINFIKTKLTWFLILFAAGTGLSALFSGAKQLSFWGLGGSQPFSGLSIVLLITLFFLSMVLFSDKNILRRCLFVFSLSSAILFVFSLLLALFVGLFKVGFLIKIFGSPAWNTFGSINGLAIFAAACFVFAMATLLGNHNLSRGFRNTMIIQAISALLLVLIVGYAYAYLAVALAAACFIGLLFARLKKESVKRVNVPLLVFVCFLMLFIFGVSFSRFFSFPAEVSPTMSLSFQVGWKTMSASVKNFVLGSGPSTFAYDFARYRPEALNQTNFWDTRFTSGFAAAPTLMAELGLFGLFFLGVFVIYKLIYLFRRVLKGPEGEEEFFTGLFLAFLVLIASLFFYPLSFISFFYLIFILAAAVAVSGLTRGETRTFSFETLPHKALMRALFMIGALIGSIFLLFISLSHLVADFKYTQGLKALASGQGDKAVARLAEAVNWYQDDVYSRNLALVSLDNTLNKLNKGDLSAADATAINNALQSVLAIGRQATQINPIERENWFALGALYEKLIPFVEGSTDQAVEAYAKAQEIEPNSPLAYLAQGRAYLTGAAVAGQNLERAKNQKTADQKTLDALQKQKDELYDKAKERLELAVAKKDNWEAPYLVLAQYFEQKKDIDQAIVNLKKARALNGQSVDSLFNLGRLYYNQGKNDETETVMKNILSAMPEHRNALFILGLVYDAKGEAAKALEQLEKLAKLEPDNKEVAKMVANLKAGKKATEKESAPAE
ncbi:MAG: tetratricopeptide repeat protein [bacterium]|nr:tetratricopeptide repeat protein [bacterium]